MGGAKTLSIIVAANIKGLETSMARANKSIGSFASNAARLGSMLTFGVTAPLAAMGKTALSTFVEFEDGMMKVKAITGATDKEFKMLTENAKELGKSTRFTSQQFAELQLVLGRKGFNPEAIKDMTSSISKLALATGSDLTLAAEVVASSINTFNLASTDAAAVANTLASAAANSSIELGTFSTAFGHAGTAANAVGVDIEELSAMMGVLMDNGIKASKAGTGLRTAFSRLNEEGIPFGQTLDALAQGTMSLNDATKLVGRTGANQLIILANQRTEINKLTNEYRTNTTELDRMSDMMSQTSANKIAIMNSAINTMNLEFGALLAQSLTPVINAITDLATKFSNLETSTKKIIISVGSFLAILGPGLLTLAAFSGAITVLSGAVATASGSLFTAYLSTMKFTGGIVAAGTAAFTTGGFVGVLTAAVRGLNIAIASNPLGAIAVGLLAIAGASLAMGDDVEDAKDSLDDLNNTIDYSKQILPQTQERFENFSGVFKSGQKPIKEFKKDIEKISGVIEEAASFGVDFTNVNWKSIGSALSFDNFEDGLIPIPDDADENAEKVFTKLEIAARNLNKTLTEVGLNIAFNFSQGFAELFVRVRDSEGAIVSFGEKFKQFAKQFLTQISTMILQAAIFAALLSVIFPKQAIGGASFMNNFQDILRGGSGLQGRAKGGPVAGNRPYLVGENGPELFMSGAAGTIIPNHALGGGSVIPDVRISGNDLLIVFDRAKRIKNRR